MLHVTIVFLTRFLSPHVRDRTTFRAATYKFLAFGTSGLSSCGGGTSAYQPKADIFAGSDLCLLMNPKRDIRALAQQIERVDIIYVWADQECGWHYCAIANTRTQTSKELTHDGYS